MTRVHPLPVRFRKPPLCLFGFVLCRHVWLPFWKALDANTSVEVRKCARCLKECA